MDAAGVVLQTVCNYIKPKHKTVVAMYPNSVLMTGVQFHFKTVILGGLRNRIFSFIYYIPLKNFMGLALFELILCLISLLEMDVGLFP